MIRRTRGDKMAMGLLGSQAGRSDSSPNNLPPEQKQATLPMRKIKAIRSRDARESAYIGPQTTLAPIPPLVMIRSRHSREIHPDRSIPIIMGISNKHVFFTRQKATPKGQ